MREREYVWEREKKSARERERGEHATNPTYVQLVLIEHVPML